MLHQQKIFSLFIPTELHCRDTHRWHTLKNAKMFQVKTIPTCPKRILQSYQADEKFLITFTEKIVIKTKEKEFTTSIYPFLQSDHLLDQLKGMSKNW